MAFLQKCHYKWQPRKCLGLEVASLIILFQKMAKRILKNHEKAAKFHLQKNKNIP
jgi:hypothetical protein